MTNISFHFNVNEPLTYACRLVRKAWLQQQAVLVVGALDWLEAFDARLWTFSETDFIAHAFVGDAVDEVSDDQVQVWLATPEQIQTDAASHAGFLIHCGDAQPTGFERFDRLIEIVPQTPSSVTLARERWKYYRQRGYPLTHHDAKN